MLDRHDGSRRPSPCASRSGPAVGSAWSYAVARVRVGTEFRQRSRSPVPSCDAISNRRDQSFSRSLFAIQSCALSSRGVN